MLTIENMQTNQNKTPQTSKEVTSKRRKGIFTGLQSLYLVGADPFPYPFKRFLKRLIR